MDKESDIVEYSPKISMRMAFSRNGNIRPKMNRNQATSRDYGRLKLLGAQILLSLTLIVSLITTIGTVWLIFRLRLGKSIGVMEYNHDEQGNDELVFNQNLQTDTLIPHDNLRLDTLTGKHIEILGSTKDHQEGAQITMMRDSINMQAKVFSSDVFQNAYSYKLPKKLNVLDVPNGVNNVKVIRAPSSKRSFSADDVGISSNLEIYSQKSLDFSGNMGLRIHARKLHLHSPETILLGSREESILINSKGLLLPNLPLEDVYLRNMLIKTNKSTIDGNQVVPIKHRLCIRRDDGLVFYSTSETCH